jgi:hypothetical protein
MLRQNVRFCKPGEKMTQKFAIDVVIITCRERAVTFARTVASLARTDYDGEIWKVCDNDQSAGPSRPRAIKNFQRALSFCSDFASHYLGAQRFVLLTEDDVRFNAHLAHNLRTWLQRFDPNHVGSLYRTSLSDAVGNQALLATPKMFASLAFKTQSLPWRALDPQDVWLRRVAHVVHHTPSLVEHDDNSSTLEHMRHRAIDFDEQWRA